MTSEWGEGTLNMYVANLSVKKAKKILFPKFEN